MVYAEQQSAEMHDIDPIQVPQTKQHAEPRFFVMWRTGKLFPSAMKLCLVVWN